MASLLETIDDPADLRKLPRPQLKVLAALAASGLRDTRALHALAIMVVKRDN